MKRVELTDFEKSIATTLANGFQIDTELVLNQTAQKLYECCVALMKNIKKKQLAWDVNNFTLEVEDYKENDYIMDYGINVDYGDDSLHYCYIYSATLISDTDIMVIVYNAQYGEIYELNADEIMHDVYTMLTIKNFILNVSQLKQENYE